MKQKLLLVIFFLSFAVISHAQAPQAIPYQAFARNNEGFPIVNQSISLRFSIHDAISTGTIVFQEEQNATTNNLGLFTTNIGQGSVITGTFASVNWGSGSKFMQVEMDVNGGTNYTDMGTQQLLSVPYALNGIPPGTKNGQMLFWNGTSWISIDPGSTGETLTFCNGLPSWGACILICNQIWKAKNLDVSTYRNGDIIPQVTDPTQWQSLTTAAWCYYNNDPANEAIYGKLYNWYAVNDPRGLAPIGWHIPSDTEWATLISCLGGSNVASGKLKEAGTSHWLNPNGDATNSSGFTGLPGGLLGNGGNFFYLGTHGYWWSSTEREDNSTNAWSYILRYDDGTIYRFDDRKEYGYSVRCIRD